MRRRLPCPQFVDGCCSIYDVPLPGANELHATFFDASGTELPVQTVTMAAATADGIGAILSPRQLEPGHFVADSTVAAGPLGVDVAGPAPDGTQLHAHVDIDVQP